MARTGGRKLFDAARREVFLEWFAATCNVKLSAEKAGVAYQTVFKHRMKDEVFAAEWDRALQQGYAYLEARLLEEAMTGPPLDPLPLAGGEVLAEAEKHFDPQLAIVLLREHARRLPSSTDKRKNLRTTARVATNAEVKAALVKRLRAFALRQSSGQALRQGSGEMDQGVSVIASGAKQSRTADWIAASPSAPRNDEEE